MICLWIEAIPGMGCTFWTGTGALLDSQNNDLSSSLQITDTVACHSIVGGNPYI